MRPGEREIIVNIRARREVGYQPEDVARAVGDFLHRHEGNAVRFTDEQRGLTIVVRESDH
jgi:hypothetical protein